MSAAGLLPDGFEDLGVGDDTLDLPTDAELRARDRERAWDELAPDERRHLRRTTWRRS